MKKSCKEQYREFLQERKITKVESQKKNDHTRHTELFLKRKHTGQMLILRFHWTFLIIKLNSCDIQCSIHA
jgi:hypothetical protein